MVDPNFPYLVASFSLFYAAVSLGSLLTKNTRFQRFMAIMQPTMHVSMVLVALTGLGVIR